MAFVSALLNMALEGTRVQWLQQLEAAQQLTRHGHDGSPVVELSTVVGGTEDCHHVAIVRPVIALKARYDSFCYHTISGEDELSI